MKMAYRAAEALPRVASGLRPDIQHLQEEGNQNRWVRYLFSFSGFFKVIVIYSYAECKTSSHFAKVGATLFIYSHRARSILFLTRLAISLEV